MVAQGSFGELMQVGIDFVNLLTEDEDSASRKGSLISEKGERSSICYIDQTQLAERKQQKLEQKASGSIGTGIYGEYLKSAESTLMFVLVGVLFVLCQASLNASDYWLSYW